MTINLAKSAIDLGIVVSDGERALAFYRDVVGFSHEADVPMPLGGGGTMHRLWCGDSLIKLVDLNTTPEADDAAGIVGRQGYRYFTITVSNLDEVVAKCEAAGAPIPVPISEVRPGVRIAMVEDPDGNWVEFLQTAA